MGSIRPFQNVDLPHLARVWIEHWSVAGAPPPVSAAMIEQIVLSRTFLDSAILLVAESDAGESKNRPQLEAWCHLVPDQDDRDAIVLASICFTTPGSDLCDSLLSAAEQQAASTGFHRVLTGPLRDQSCGYAGLPPIGHGIGTSESDNRTSSILQRRGYHPAQPVTRMLANSNPYRMPVKRSFMQLLRSTRIRKEILFPQEPHHASAMSHIDIEHHQLTNHLTGQRLASVNLWLSDPEAQVFTGSHAMLDLSTTQQPGDLTEEEQFLIGSIISTSASRRVFEIETAVDNQDSQLINKLSEIHFKSVEQGCRWIKELRS